MGWSWSLRGASGERRVFKRDTTQKITNITNTSHHSVNYYFFNLCFNFNVEHLNDLRTSYETKNISAGRRLWESVVYSMKGYCTEKNLREPLVIINSALAEVFPIKYNPLGYLFTLFRRRATRKTRLSFCRVGPGVSHYALWWLYICRLGWQCIYCRQCWAYSAKRLRRNDLFIGG